MKQSFIIFVTTIILVVTNLTVLCIEAAHGDTLDNVSLTALNSKKGQGQHTSSAPALAITSAHKSEWEMIETRKSLARALAFVSEERLIEALHILNPFSSSSACRYEFNVLHGAILASLQQWEEAIRDYQNALRYRPDSVRALVLLGDALVATGDTHAGIAAYTSALALDPEDCMAYLGRGFAWGEFDEIERSLTDINKGIDLLREQHKTDDVELATWREIAKETCPAHWPDGGTDKLTILKFGGVN